MSESIHFWRRTDVEGLERLELAIEPEGVRATSTVICLEAGGFRLDHRWQLDADWRAQFVTVERWNSQGHGILRLERAGAGWRVDGGARPDLEGAEEPDLPVTPFCNTFPIRRTPEDAGASLTLDTALIDGSALTVARSTQRYDRQGPGRLRHVDLGLSRGFEADLVVDGSGLVLRYPRIFDYQRHDMANGGDRISRRCAPAPCRGSLPGNRSALQATYDRRQQLEPICWHGSRDHAGCDRAEVTPLVQCSSVGCDRILVPWPTKSTYGTPPKDRSFLRERSRTRLRRSHLGQHTHRRRPPKQCDRSPRSGGHVRKSPRRPAKVGERPRTRREQQVWRGCPGDG